MAAAERGTAPAMTSVIATAVAASGREVRRVKLLRAAEAARAYRANADAAGIKRRRAPAGIGHLRGIGAGDQFGLGIGQLDAECANAGFKGIGGQDRETR